MRRGAFGLQPLSEAAPGPRQAELRAEARLQRCWALVVGAALQRHTRLLRVTRGRLVLGCWETAHLSSLRASAQAAWPQVQERIQRYLGLRLSAIEVLPCDPPAPPDAPDKPVEDPLRAVLERLRKPGRGGAETLPGQGAPLSKGRAKSRG